MGEKRMKEQENKKNINIKIDADLLTNIHVFKRKNNYKRIDDVIEDLLKKALKN